jgi:hypothetical protein
VRAGQRQGEAALVAGPGHHGGAAECEGAAQHAFGAVIGLRQAPLEDVIRRQSSAVTFDDGVKVPGGVKLLCLSRVSLSLTRAAPQAAEAGPGLCALVDQCFMGCLGPAAVGRRGGLGGREGLAEGGRDPAGQVPAVLHRCAALREPAARARPLCPVRAPAPAASVCTLSLEPASVWDQAGLTWPCRLPARALCCEVGQGLSQ